MHNTFTVNTQREKHKFSGVRKYINYCAPKELARKGFNPLTGLANAKKKDAACMKSLLYELSHRAPGIIQGIPGEFLPARKPIGRMQSALNGSARRILSVLAAPTHPRGAKKAYRKLSVNRANSIRSPR